MLALTMLAGCKFLEENVENEQAQADPADGSGTQNSAPTIWGDPETSVVAGTQYLFMPESDDADGDVLTFDIANKPSWATFSDDSGTLQGVPGENNVGSDDNIVISVSDGTSVVSLPSFAITVESAGTPDDGSGDDGGSSTSPPSISGQPNSSVVVGSQYTFQPDASDPDDDTLSFSIVNKPTWATFSTVTGRLQGTPDASHIGTTSNIQLSVTDGDYIDSLAPFSITVEAAAAGSKTISWTPPTENDDGSDLTDLAGYRIYYGTVSGEYNVTIPVNSSGVTSYLIDNLAYGTYYVVMTSVNSQDVESMYSAELAFEIGN